MADLSFKERLQPSLLDRLCDDEPGRKTEGPARRSMTMRQLRQSVLRDLAWLLNTTHLGSVVDIEEWPMVAASVLNFGIPELTGVTASSLDPVVLERQVREAVMRFEPRILPPTVRVRAVTTPDAEQRNVLFFEITGELWAQPANERLMLMTQVDLETGDIAVRDGLARESG